MENTNANTEPRTQTEAPKINKKTPSPKTVKEEPVDNHIFNGKEEAEIRRISKEVAWQEFTKYELAKRQMEKQQKSPWQDRLLYCGLVVAGVATGVIVDRVIGRPIKGAILKS
jgi:hypothetical protein